MVERADSKTLIGVLASHDSPRPNQRLIALFNHFYDHPHRERLERFHFVFTGGTYDRIFFGSEELNVSALRPEVADWLQHACGVTRLRSTQAGGVIVLSFLISQQDCSIVWPFYA